MAQAAIFLTVILSLGLALALPPMSPVIQPSLLATLKTKGTTNVAVILKNDVSSVFSQYDEKTYAVRGEKMTQIRSALMTHTAAVQRPLLKALDSHGVKYKSFWITNRVIVSNADLDLVQELASISDVSEVREEIVIPVPEYKVSDSKQVPVVRGVHKVRAHELWARNLTGAGLVVSNIDTGVRGTHEVLRDNFLGEYGWYEPGSPSAEPRDRNGHGTHTMGTIAGQRGFGVAPGAKWMACMGCAGSSCSESDLIGCGQFIACPHDPFGNNANCSKAPHVVGNSWGSTLGGQTWYDDVIRGFHAAGVIPVFSAGNAGSSCGSVGSPGDRDVIGVAATDMDDVIAYFSSRGPSTDGKQKPEISAPGVNVMSAWNFADDSFTSLDGTSMACPHVAGGVALLIENNPMLRGNYEGMRTALFEGARKTGLVGSSQTCGGIDDATFPNMVFGHGLLDLVGASNRTM